MCLVLVLCANNESAPRFDPGTMLNWTNGTTITIVNAQCTVFS